MLHRRGNIYLSRIIVPADLQGVLGRVEITRSLRTGDRREALERLPLWESKVRTYLSLVRKHHVTMTRAQLDALTRQYLERTKDEIEERLALPWDEAGFEAHQIDLIDAARKLSADLSKARYDSLVSEARQLASAENDQAVRRLARRLMEAKLEAIEAEIKAIDGEPLRLPTLDRLASAPAPVATPPATSDSPRLSEVVLRYAESKRASQEWSDRSEEHYTEIYATLVSLMGDPKIGDVSKADIRQLGLSLAKYPKNAKKVLPGLSPSEALARAADDDSIAKLAPRSVNAYQQAARSLFKWAHDHDLIPTNPAKVLKDQKTRTIARDERLPLTDDDLRAYFKELERDRGESPWLYWVAVIMAYTGCRLGEAAQLRKEDIRQESDIWVIDINENHPSKKLKNPYSKRLVPVHPRLLELGILNLTPSSEDGFLWPAPMRTPRRKRASPVDRLQRRLATRLDRAGITDPRKTGAHSLRHTVSARLKAASVPEYQISEIHGHKDRSISTGRYGTTTDLAKLRDVIQLLKLPI